MTEAFVAVKKGGKKSKTTGLRHKAAHDPRTAALSAVYSVLYEDADSQAALDLVLGSLSLVPTDRRLCTELVYGVLRWYLRLQAEVDTRLKNPDKLPREMRLVLAAALYEMAVLRIPAHATLNWAVQHIRNRFGAGLAGVANGVLRTLQRQLPIFRISPGRVQAESAVENPGQAVPGTPADTNGATEKDRRALEPGTVNTIGTIDTIDTTEIDAASPSSTPAAPPSDATLARRYAMPVWIVTMWREQYGIEEVYSLLSASQQAPLAGVRLNKSSEGWQTLREDILEAAAEEAGDTTAIKSTVSVKKPKSSRGSAAVLAVGDCALSFAGSVSWSLREPLRDGRASRQSAASYEALFAFAPDAWKQPIWDACAGRGGKTLALLEAGIPVALASDPSVRRLRALPEDFKRLRLSAVTDLPCLRKASATDAPLLFTADMAFALADTEEFVPEKDDSASPDDATPVQLAVCPDRFGTVLIDAPCSGLGTLARRPEIRLRRTPEECAELVETQRRILDAAWDSLLPGGTIIYLTCTRNKAENQDQAAAFLARHTDAVLEQEFETLASSPLREFFYGAKIRKPV